MQRASHLSATSGDALFQDLADELKTKCNWFLPPNHLDSVFSVSVDERAQKTATHAIATSQKLVQLARKSENFTEVLNAAKNHLTESLGAWSISEYEHASMDVDLRPLPDNKAQPKAIERKITKSKLNLWILKQIEDKDRISDPHGVLAEFFRSQNELYSEEDETIRMISLFSVYRANGVKQYFDCKILCEVAHPITTPELQYEDDFLFRCLDQLNTSCCGLVAHINQLEEDILFNDHEAKELLRIHAMAVWKSLRCFKLVAFTSDVMTEILQMPSFSGESMWTHATSDQWSIGVGMRDSPVIETVTVGVIVIIGLLCTPAALSKILLTPDVYHIKRAVTMLTSFTEKYRPLTTVQGTVER